MFRLDSRALVLSVGDLVHASRCEYGLLREIDRYLGRIGQSGTARPDSAWLKLIRRGQMHEKSVLAEYRHQFGASSVVEIDRPRELSERALDAASRRTVDAMRRGAQVVYQATIFDGRLLGYADFLVREPDGRWRVEDTKLTAASGYEAQMQVAAYAAVLGAAGVELTGAATIRLGDGTEVAVSLDETVPAFIAVRERLQELADSHVASGVAAVWGVGDFAACNRCAQCAEAIAASRDLLLVDGVRAEERAALHRAGIRTIDELATGATVTVDLPRSTFARLRRQAALQLRPGELPNVPAFETVRADLLGRLPKANPGDLFLSFAAQGRSKDVDTDVDHLFTVTAAGGAVQTYWGDDRATEATEFVRFIAGVGERRRQHPAMRIYHYSPIDRPHLVDLAERAGAARAEVESLISDGVLVDLFTVVDGALVVGTPDRSLRQVGRLTDPDGAERLAITDVAADRAEYHRLLGTGDVDGAAALRSRLERENQERCILTQRLRDWLLDLMAIEGVQPGSAKASKRVTHAQSEVAQAIELRDLAGADDLHGLARAALGYHQRESAVFWRDHARRLYRHTSEWSTRTRGAVRIDQVKIEQDWTEGKRGGFTRTLRLRVTTSPGTAMKVSDQPFLVYDGDPPFHDPRAAPGARMTTDAVVLEHTDDELVVQERLPKAVAPWQHLPSAAAPSRPPRTSAIEVAVEGWAASLLRDDDEPNAATDLVRRSSPRLAESGVVRIAGLDGRTDVRASLVQSLLSLDRSFLAVQGPPGSGKTTVGSQVIADLLERGWRIGVVAQSHAVIEHFLERVVAAGAPADRVAKNVKDGYSRAFTPIGRDAVKRFMNTHEDGFVVGGTAWDFTNLKRVPRGSLDLLVIDEAGQFGLVNAIAVSQATKNLLLLGDPQQLPQVSQAVHRAAADSSALGWLLDGRSVLPHQYGYFLDRTWRMHPALTRAVSDLSYDKELQTHPAVSLRMMDGVAPGLHLQPVRHLGNTDSAREEAVEIVRLIRGHLGRSWTPGEREPARPLQQRDIIVVAPYNAQVDLVSRELRQAGLPDVEVGTVDRFQGREAAIAIYSATVSSLALRPQAADFVLGRNRLNVAISRAQWAAYIVHSAKLADFTPRNAPDAAALSRFLRLSGFARSGRRSDSGRPDRPAA